jgi:5-methyltetrahydrofolate--homocysteine methyltransferase
MMDLLEYLTKSEGVLLLDGGMGTQLDARGAEMGGEANLTDPEKVLAVHQSYVEEGAMLLITNTLTMNRVNIETHDVGVDVREVNLVGARLARQAAVSGQYVLGDIGSTGQILAPLGTVTEEEAFVSYKEQAELLIEGGVDGFIIETMFDLRETLVAVRACKAAADLPVIASMTFETIKNGGRTIMGNTVAECAVALTEAGADVIGANCGSLTPMELSEVVKWITEATHLPVAVQPNAGKPHLEGLKAVFDMSPEEFAEGIAMCIKNGAKIVGGCCGTTPAHLHAIKPLTGKVEPS